MADWQRQIEHARDRVRLANEGEVRGDTSAPQQDGANKAAITREDVLLAHWQSAIEILKTWDCT